MSIDGDYSDETVIPLISLTGPENRLQVDPHLDAGAFVGLATPRASVSGVEESFYRSSPSIVYSRLVDMVLERIWSIHAILLNALVGYRAVYTGACMWPSGKILSPLK